MNLKNLNSLGSKNSFVATGYVIYIGVKERWKDGIYNSVKTEYYVSSLGRVYNKKKNQFGRIFVNDSGYLYCQSYYKGKRTSLLINRLVLESFKGNPEIEDMEADHINNCKIDNSLGNLQWLSREDNLAKRRMPNQSEENNSNVKYSKEKIDEISRLLSKGEFTLKEVSSITGIPYSTIVEIKNKTRWNEYLKDKTFKVKKGITQKQTYKISQILYVANLLTENKLSIKEISDLSGVSIDMIYSIKGKKSYKNILEDYDFSNYTGKNVFTQKQNEIIDQLILKELNPRQICEKLNIEYSKKNRNALYERKRKIKHQ